MCLGGIIWKLRGFVRTSLELKILEVLGEVFIKNEFKYGNSASKINSYRSARV